MTEANIELFEKLSRLQWMLHKHHLRGYAENGPMANPTRGQGRILAMLKMRDGVSAKDLSYLLSIRVSSLNELLAKLEKNGYIVREPSEVDKRVMLVKLTEKGRNERQQDFSDMFSCLLEDEQKTFGQYLDRVIASFAMELGDDDDDTDLDQRDRIRERIGDEIFDMLAFTRRNGFESSQGFSCSPRHNLHMES
ncbi:MAG: MarR family transcriptional regulator [Clostridiales bacterium]|nr:MarR family transcriptional regulator [Clostridiales bacterium]